MGISRRNNEQDKEYTNYLTSTTVEAYKSIYHISGSKRYENDDSIEYDTPIDYLENVDKIWLEKYSTNENNSLLNIINCTPSLSVEEDISRLIDISKEIVSTENNAEAFYYKNMDSSCKVDTIQDIVGLSSNLKFLTITATKERIPDYMGAVSSHLAETSDINDLETKSKAILACLYESNNKQIRQSLQAFKRYKVDPIILIVCVNNLDSYVVQQTMASRFPGVYVFGSEPWAADCFIISKESLGEINLDTPLNSLIALGLFFTSRAPSIMNAPFADDPKMQYLYTLALSHEEDQHNNILLSLLESQNRKYERLLSLANTVGSKEQ